MKKVIDNAWDSLSKRSNDVEKFEAVFDLNIDPKDKLYANWLSLMNNLVNWAITSKHYDIGAKWASKAKKYARDNHNLSHNLACAFALNKDLDQAFKMCEIAVEIGYSQLWQLISDKDLRELAKESRFKKLMTNAHSKRKGRTPPPEWGYHFDEKTKKSISPRTLPPLLDDLFFWLQYQPHGSVGIEGIRLGSIGKEWHKAIPKKLRDAMYTFFTLGEGTDICIVETENTNMVVALGGEGEIKLLAGSLENFLIDWSNRNTGFIELDDDGNDISMRSQFKSWLKFMGLKKEKVPGEKKLFDKWYEQLDME